MPTVPYSVFDSVKDVAENDFDSFDLDDALEALAEESAGTEIRSDREPCHPCLATSLNSVPLDEFSPAGTIAEFLEYNELNGTLITPKIMSGELKKYHAKSKKADKDDTASVDANGEGLDEEERRRYTVIPFSTKHVGFKAARW